MPTIQGPTAAAHAGPPPTFEVDPSPNRFYACELATQAVLFDTANRSGDRTSENFYASWSHAQFASASTFQTPEAAWMRFEHANRLYYRALTSASSTQWRNVQATTPDAEAQSAPFIQLVQLVLGGVLTESQVPVAEIWTAAQQMEAIRAITASGECQALMVWHMFSPKRPIDPQAAEWVVIVTSLPSHAEERVDVGMVRLAAQTLIVKDVKDFHDIQMPMEEVGMLEHINSGHLQFSADQLARKGAFWIATDLRPAPTETGGAVIVHARTNRILYRATTEEEAQGAVLIP